MVSKRFHAISKPQPKQRSDAWTVWRWCCESLGLITYISTDECVVTNANEYYTENSAPGLIYGHNILDFGQEVDTHVR